MILIDFRENVSLHEFWFDVFFFFSFRHHLLGTKLSKIRSRFPRGIILKFNIRLSGHRWGWWLLGRCLIFNRFWNWGWSDGRWSLDFNGDGLISVGFHLDFLRYEGLLVLTQHMDSDSICTCAFYQFVVLLVVETALETSYTSHSLIHEVLEWFIGSICSGKSIPFHLVQYFIFFFVSLLTENVLNIVRVLLLHCIFKKISFDLFRLSVFFS